MAQFTEDDINSTWGFFGTLADWGNVSRADVMALYNQAVDLLGGDPAVARQYLDSTAGRHFVDSLSFLVNGVDKATAQEISDALAGSKLGKHTSWFWKNFKRFKAYESTTPAQVVEKLLGEGEGVSRVTRFIGNGYNKEELQVGDTVRCINNALGHGILRVNKKYRVTDAKRSVVHIGREGSNLQRVKVADTPNPNLWWEASKFELLSRGGVAHSVAENDSPISTFVDQLTTEVKSQGGTVPYAQVLGPEQTAEVQIKLHGQDKTFSIGFGTDGFLYAYEFTEENGYETDKSIDFQYPHQLLSRQFPDPNDRDEDGPGVNGPRDDFQAGPDANVPHWSDPDADRGPHFRR